MRRLLLVLLQETSGLIQDVAILCNEKVSVSLVNLELLQIVKKVEVSEGVGYISSALRKRMNGSQPKVDRSIVSSTTTLTLSASIS